MPEKSSYFGRIAFLGLATATLLFGGLSRHQGAPGGAGISPARQVAPPKANPVPATTHGKSSALIRSVGKVPIFFVPNLGQTNDRVGFYVQGYDKTSYFAPDGVTFALNYPTQPGSNGATGRWAVKLDYLGANKDVVPEGLEKTGAVISYFRGKPEEWKSGLPAYSGIIYRNLWPGIDLAYKGDRDRLKYEFIVHPGADPSKIKLAYRGAECVTLTEEGRLKVKTPAGGFEDDIPVAYQEVDGNRVDVPVTYSLEDVAKSHGSEAVFGSGVTSWTGPEALAFAYVFVLGEYDSSRTLVIDPAVIVYCGYIGGAGDEDSGYGIAVDTSGNAYITGPANSDESSFPMTVGPDLTHNGARDAFVAKVNPSGTGLIYCGYIGGLDNEQGMTIAVDDSGNAYVTGLTTSTEATFPVTVGPDLIQNGGEDAFVAKVNSSGTGLVYCGYIGGSADDMGSGIAVDDSGNAYVTGTTESSQATFPVTLGPDITYNGGYCDAFVAKVNASGTALIYCGYIGGSGYDNGCTIAVDSSENAYVTGMTLSSQVTFPVVVGPDLTYNGSFDLYVAKVNASGTGLVYCGYIGGSDWEEYSTIAVDASGNAYIAGSTGSTEATLPVTVGPDLTYNGGMSDGFVTKVNPSGTGLVYCGYIGGSGWDTSSFIAINASGEAYVSGTTESDESTFPVADGPDLTYNGGFDAFVAKVDSSGTRLVYCGYIGGINEDSGYQIAVDASGNAYVTGNTSSSPSTFPVLVGPDLTLDGQNDAFVAKIGTVPGPPLTSLLPDSADAGDPGFTLTVTGSDFVDGAVVRWDGSARPTTFISSSELSAEIDAVDLAAGKTVYVTVRNPDGGISNALAFAVSNPVPSLDSVSPTSVTGGGAAFTLTVQGSSFVPNSVIRWNDDSRTTTYISSTELQGAILSTDIATGEEAQVTVLNPAPAGGTSEAITLPVSGFTLGSSPASVTVTAGQSATYAIQVTPQYGSFDAAVAFACAGLPSKCTASFSPTSVIPGADVVTTTLTLTTASAAGSTGAALFGTTGIGPQTLGLLALVVIPLSWAAFHRCTPRKLARRCLTACALVCLVILIGSCGGGGADSPPSTGTPKGTYQISVQGSSGFMTVSMAVTLAVN